MDIPQAASLKQKDLPGAIEGGLNTKPLSVGVFTQQIKQILEGHCRGVWVVGEVSTVRKQSNGHYYFTLKDEQATLSCVLFRGKALRNTHLPEEGHQLIVFGDISLYEPRGTYQLIVEATLQAGAGEQHKAFEALKKQLTEEGLFDKARKAPIPLVPRKIAFVTSASGAVLKDFISVLNRYQWTGEFIVVPTLVQGKEAAKMLATGALSAEKIPNIDLIVIGRGGGSLEDLWPFNEESLVRTLAQISTPIISAVGHETDYTLCDFVADWRAETPTAAAEHIGRNFQGYLQTIRLMGERLTRQRQTILRQFWERFDFAQRHFFSTSIVKKLPELLLRLDHLTDNLAAARERFLSQKTRTLERLQSSLTQLQPKPTLQKLILQVEHLQKRLENTRLEAVLQRGFAAIQDPNGGYIIDKKAFEALRDSGFSIQFKDGIATSPGTRP